MPDRAHDPLQVQRDREEFLAFVESRIAPTGWKVSRTYLQGERKRLVFEDTDGQTVESWFMAPTEGERAYRTGDGFLFGHAGRIDHRTASRGMNLLDTFFDLLQELSRKGRLERLWGDTPLDPKGEEGVRFEREDSIEIRLTTACTEECRYCFYGIGSTVYNLAQSADEVVAIMKEARSRGVSQVVLTGGEPTLVPWLVDVCRQASRMGFENTEVQTNGTLLNSRELTLKLSGIKGLSLLVSLPGHTAEITGAITGRADLFERKVQGLIAALDAGVSTSVNHVSCRWNMAHTVTFVEWLYDLAGPYLESLLFSFSIPHGRAWEDGKKTVPSYSEVAPHMLAGLKRAEELGMKAHLVTVCGIPTCIEPELRNYAGVAKPYVTQATRSKNTLFPGCRRCAWNESCVGVMPRYLELYGTGEFSALMDEESQPGTRKK